MLSLLVAAALAAPRNDLPVEDLLKRPGLVVVEIAKPDTCTEPWAAPEVTGWAKEHPDVTLASAPYTKGSYATLVGKGFAPTVIKLAYRDGKELDRACECLEGPRLAGWLDAVATGRTLADLHRDGLAAEEGLNVTGWLELVQLHYCANRVDQAFDAAAFLWDTIPKASPEDREVRLTRVAHDLGVLAAKHEPSRVRLLALRDALEAPKDTDRDALDAWVALNRTLMDDDRTIAWFDAVRANPAAKAQVEAQAPNLFYLLAERGRWAEAGQIIDDLPAWLALWKAQKAGLDTSVWGYGALRAAGRDKDAAVLAKDILKVAPENTACRLLAKSVEVGAASSSEKGLTKDCTEADVVAAWNAAVAK